MYFVVNLSPATTGVGVQRSIQLSYGHKYVVVKLSPATTGVGVQRSIQLSYGHMYFVLNFSPAANGVGVFAQDFDRQEHRLRTPMPASVMPAEVGRCAVGKF